MQENGLERGLGNGHLGLDNSRTHIMRPTSERDIGLHETDFWAYSAGENIQTTIITRISAYGVKHTQVKSTLSPNEAGNNVNFWLNFINQGGKIHMVIHSFSLNDVKKNHHEENMYQESNHETLHSLMKSSSPIAKMWYLYIVHITNRYKSSQNPMISLEKELVKSWHWQCQAFDIECTQKKICSLFIKLIVRLEIPFSMCHSLKSYITDNKSWNL